MMDSSWISVADAGAGACIVVSSVVGVAVGVGAVCTGVDVGVCIVVSVVGVVCAGVGVAVSIVVSDAVGVCASVVYVGVGGGMQLTNCVNSSCSLKAISTFLCIFKSFLLCYNVLESIC